MRRKRHMLADLLQVIGVPILLLMLALAVSCVARVDAGVPADPPYIVRITSGTTAYAPDGTRIALPTGTEIDACGGTPIILRTAARVADVAACQRERPLFRDGFEG